MLHFSVDFLLQEKKKSHDTLLLSWAELGHLGAQLSQDVGGKKSPHKLSLRTNQTHSQQVCVGVCV